MNISSSTLSMVSTLVVVVLVAFSLSALLRNIKSLTLTKNYGISGVLGVIAGILYYIWAADHVDAMVIWLKDYGVLILLLIIFICAAALYVMKGNKEGSHNQSLSEESTGKES